MIPRICEKCRELGVSCFEQKPIALASSAKAFADTVTLHAGARLPFRASN